MKKGCGTKKMAKGGAVKVSPRKAMAMGKKPAGVKKFAAGGAVMAPQQKRKTGLGFIQEPPIRSTGLPARPAVVGRGTGTMTQQGMQQARQVDKITSPPSSLPPPAGTRKELGQYLTPPPVRRFKKGGSVKKGGK